MALGAIAARHHGIVTTADLRRLGVSANGVAYRLRVGRLHAIHRGVYAVGRRELTTTGRYLAAVRAVGLGTAISHLAAAILWAFWPDRQEEATPPVDVSIASRRGQRPGIRLHVVRELRPSDVTVHRGVPVTTPARTLLDLADVLVSDRALSRAVHEAQVQRRVNLRQIEVQLEQTSGRQAATRLAKIIAAGPAPTRSELEDRVLELILGSGLPHPQTNTRVKGRGGAVEVDFLFPALKLVIEADGARFHDTRLAREADAHKQAVLEAAGYRVIRLRWKQVTTHRPETERRLRSAYEQQCAALADWSSRGDAPGA